jgi:hypothetical protein
MEVHPGTPEAYRSSRRADAADVVVAIVDGVGFQNAAKAGELDFYAARSYSVISPPRMGRRSCVRSVGGRSGRGGCSSSERCGRRAL